MKKDTGYVSLGTIHDVQDVSAVIFTNLFTEKSINNILKFMCIMHTLLH